MIKKINIFLVLLLLLLSISAVSAADDVNSTVMGSNDAMDIDTSEGDNLLSSDVADEELLTSSVHVVDSSSYYNYFTSKGAFIPSSINEGDTLQIDGKFNGKDFTFRNPVNIVGTSTNDMKNCIFTFYENASGSTISNLKIANTNDYSYGIFLNGAQNCTIHDCIINNTGQSSYAICVANSANYNNISNNVLNTYGLTYGHGTRSTPSLLLCNAHYNYIGGNQITCDDANAIYLSSYEGGPLKGGESTFNTIYNNVIKYNVLPTSWAYGIQVMGANNNISSNRIIGAYRGISTSNAGNIIENNWIINLTGADYNNPGEMTGGEIAIVGSYNSTIRNNHIVNARVISTGSGISALDNSVVENNYVQVLLQGKGVYPQGSNILIKNNTIITNSGSGILYNTNSNNLKVLDNNISSNSGVGVLIQKISNKKMPGNITIVGNTISTSNKYAIDAAEANASSVNVIGPNSIKKGCEVRTPEGSYDPSKPAYNFNGTVHNINPSNYGDFINDNGGLSSDIKDGDILNFTGEFYDKVIFINSAIKITGDNPTFYNTTFRVRCDGVWIENLVIKNNKASRLNAWGILVYKVAGATITNCDIEVYDPNAAYAIYVVEASDVDVIHNKLFSSGDYLTYTLLAYAVEDCKFINNTINTLGTGVVHQFENQHCLDGDTNCLDGDTNCLDGDTNCLDGSSIGDGNHMLSEVYRTYGILMAYSSDNIVSGNIVNVTSKLDKKVSPYNSTNSIVGIDSYFNCQNNVFSDNDVYIKANDNYIYGMGVLGYTTGHNAPEGQGAINNQFINNYIVIEGTYCVEGIIIGHESHETLIKNNIINLKSDNVAYGITLEMSQKSTITDNYLALNSDVIYGVETFSSNNNNMNNNELELNGKKVYGILFSNSNYNSVISNIILANGTGEKIDFQNFDSITAGNTGIFLKSNSTNNEIRKNSITSQKGYAILVDDEAINNNITDNCLKSEKGVGNLAVNNTKNNIVKDNYGYTFAGKISSMKVNYLDTLELKLENIDDGANVRFYIDNIEIGNTTSSNGVATLNYKYIGPFNPKGNYAAYKVKAVASKENYLTKEFNTNLRVNKGNLNVVLNDALAKKLANGTFVATVSDVSGSAVSGVKVNFYRYQGRYVYIGEATTDADGIAMLIAEVPSISEGNYTISANVTSDPKFNAANGKATLSIMDNDFHVDTSLTAFAFTTAYNSGRNVIATLKDVDGNAVAGAKVKVELGDVTDVLSTDANGRVSLTVNGLIPGVYTAKFKFEGNEIYKASNVNAKVNITKANTKLTAKDTTITYNDGSNITATLKDTNGNPIDGAQIYVQVGSTNLTAMTDSEGIATVSTDGINSNTYNVNFAFLGNDLYNGISTSAKLKINKADTRMDASDVSVAYADKNGELVATLTNDVTGKAISGVNVVVNLNGESYTLKTNSKGQVKVSTAGLPCGTNTAIISYAGDANYNPSSANAVVIVNKADIIISAVKGTTGEIVATLTSKVSGNAISSAKVNFDLNGVITTVKTNTKGQAKLSTVDLPSGTYTAIISYAGNAKYNPASTSITFNTKTEMVISAVYNSAKSEIVATLINNDTGKVISNVNVKVDLNGVITTVKTNTKGQAKLSTVDLPSGTYTAIISYAGNAKYAPASTNITFATKIDTTISAVYDASNSVIVATLTNAEGKALSSANVKVSFNGETTTVKTNSKGQVKVSAAGLPLGTYPATFSYAGNAKYNSASASIDVEVKTKVIITDVYGYQDKLVATLTNGATGDPIVNAYMEVEINGVIKTAKSDSKSQISIDTSDLGLTRYDVTISYGGNSRYTPSSTTTAIDLNKANMNIKYSYNADTKELVATLKNSKTGKVVSSANMVVDINGVKTTLKSNNKGQIIFSTADFAPGTHVGTITYGGNDRYNSISAAFKVDV